MREVSDDHIYAATLSRRRHGLSCRVLLGASTQNQPRPAVQVSTGLPGLLWPSFHPRTLPELPQHPSGLRPSSPRPIPSFPRTSRHRYVSSLKRPSACLPPQPPNSSCSLQLPLRSTVQLHLYARRLLLDRTVYVVQPCLHTSSFAIPRSVFDSFRGS